MKTARLARWLLFGVLLAGIVFEGLSLRTAIAESNKQRGRTSWWSFVRSSKKPASVWGVERSPDRSTR